MLTDYPPYEYLFQIVTNYPSAANLYMQLWRTRNPKNIIYIHKKDVRMEYNTPLPKFRHDLTLLGKSEYIVWDEKSKDHFNIEIIDIPFDGKGNMPC